MKARYEFQDKELYEEYLQTFFAGIAMQGYCANPQTWQEYTQEQMIVQSVQNAKLLIAELNK